MGGVISAAKHHDGWAPFDPKSSTHWSMCHLGPKRDYIRELFDAAKNKRPKMSRGVVIPTGGSCGYNFGDWPGQLAHNADDSNKL
ncbi:hypothetical protein FRB90_004841, partial [Tulasnella sp. 427]